MRHITKDKGDLAVAKTLAHLLEHDIRVCLPLSEHLPFDFVAVMPDMDTLRRVQVKYRAAKLGTVHVVFRSNYYDSKRIYTKRVNLEEIDCYASYCPDNQGIYYLRVDEIPQDVIQICLRVSPTKNNQAKRVRMASDYADPLRIAPACDSVFVARREVSEKDEYALSKVLADLMEKELQPLIPQSQFVPFDLIAVMPDMKTMQRIRVGYRDVQPTNYVDYYAIYDPDTRQVRYIEAHELVA